MNRAGAWDVSLDDIAAHETRLHVPVKINGLPAHVLLIHAVIVIVPLAAIMLVAGAVWPAARRRLGVRTPSVALVALVLVPVTTNAGNWLRERLPASPSIEKHRALGNTLLPWAAAIFVVASALWLLARRYELTLRPSTPAIEGPAEEPTGHSGTATMTKPVAALQVLPIWATVIVAVLAIGVSTGGVVQLYRIGDSGAQAVWGGGRVPDSPVHQSGR